MIIKTYIFKCRHCSEKALLAPKICEKCGPVKIVAQKESHTILDNQSEPIFGPVLLRCASCLDILSTGETLKQDDLCRFCREDDMGWYCEEDNTWAIKEDANESPGTWLTGDFEGYFEEKNGNSNSSIKEINIYQSKLTNVKKVTQPALRQAGELKPKRFESISQVEAVLGGRPSVKLDLVDVRLHDWKSVSSFDARDAKEQYYGKIYGTAYGKLLEKVVPEEEAEEVPSNDSQKITKPVVEGGNQVLQGTDESSGAGSSQITPNLNLKPNPNVTSQATPISDCPLPDQVCIKCSWLAILLPMIVVWYFGSWHEGIIVVIPILLVCFLQTFNLFLPEITIRGRPFSFGLILVLFSIFILLLVFIIPLTDCDPRMHYWTWLIALLFVLTAFVKSCKPWHVMLVIWTLTVYISYHDPRHECPIQAPTPTPPAVVNKPPEETPKAPISRIDIFKSDFSDFKNHLIDRINKVMDGVGDHSDENDPLINKEDDQGGGRIKLDQAVKNPEKFFSCTDQAGKKQPIYDIYIGKSALFDFKSIEITPEAKNYLQKLVKLLATQPNLDITLTGYSDNKGTDEAKLQTSLLRAKQLKDWLVQENGIDPNRINVQGGSDSNPITLSNLPGLQVLNRRVELRINCPLETPWVKPQISVTPPKLNKENLKKNNKKVFTGKWKLITTLYSVKSNQKIIYYFKFNESGSGTVQIHKDNDETCSGKAVANINPDTTFNVDMSRINCPSNDYWNAESIKCTVNNVNQVQCILHCVDGLCPSDFVRDN